VRSALNTVEGIADIKTNPSDNSCSFNAPAGMDVTATLNKFAEEGNRHIKGWSLAKDDSDDE